MRRAEKSIAAIKSRHLCKLPGYLLRMHGDMDIVDPLIDEFLTRLAPSPDPLEADMRRHADELEGFPITGSLVGGLLAQLAQIVSARRIFEVGSGFGYSAFWLARASRPAAR